MRHIHFITVIWKEEAGYVSKCPELGVASAGDTPDQAKTNLQKAISLSLENAKSFGNRGTLTEIPKQIKLENGEFINFLNS